MKTVYEIDLLTLLFLHCVNYVGIFRRFFFVFKGFTKNFVEFL